MKLRINTTGVSSTCTRAPEPRTSFESGQPRIDKATGLPLWLVQVMALDSDGGDVIAVTVARDAGAECDLIADTTPGVAYVMIDGTAQPQRVRAFHVTAADITDLATRFSAPRGHSNGHSLDDDGPDRRNR
jgi:hypothetical protein